MASRKSHYFPGKILPALEYKLWLRWDHFSHDSFALPLLDFSHVELILIHSDCLQLLMSGCCVSWHHDALVGL